MTARRRAKERVEARGVLASWVQPSAEPGAELAGIVVMRERSGLLRHFGDRHGFSWVVEVAKLKLFRWEPGRWGW